MKRFSPLVCSLFILWFHQNMIGQDAISSGRFYVEPPTLICFGFEWYIGGDDNRNAKVMVDYKIKGTEKWIAAMPLLRIGGENTGNKEIAYVSPNLFSGSILDLEPDTEYEVQLTLEDPDGIEHGSSYHYMVLKTRAEPMATLQGRLRHVYPPEYDGKKEQPAYEGLMHAYYGYKRYADHNHTVDPVQPGDMILVHGGTYKADRYDYRDPLGLTFTGTYSLTHDGTAEKPIVIKSAGDGEVIFDGNGAYKLFDLMAADYHHIEGITIQNAEIGILAGEKNVLGAKGLTVKNCTIKDVGIGILARYRGCSGYYIADNYLLGRADTTRILRRERVQNGGLSQKSYSYIGIKIYGQGHTICHNHVAYFFDGIDIDTHGGVEPLEEERSSAIDVYNNDVFLANDNCFEADGGTYNIRFMRNRGFNSGQAGFSNQPLLGGPIYWIRNIGFNIPQKPAFKYWDTRAGAIVAYHNTMTSYSGRTWKGLNNGHFFNNLFLQPSDAPQPTLGMKTHTAYTQSDYNGYRFHEDQEVKISWHQPKEGVLRDYEMHHEPMTFSSLKELAKVTGQEEHSIEIGFADFINVPEPNFLQWQKDHLDPDAEAFPIWQVDGIDFNLKQGSKAIDAGKVIPNVNENYTGNAPDLGALEKGQSAPVYGPREKNKR